MTTEECTDEQTDNRKDYYTTDNACVSINGEDESHVEMETKLRYGVNEHPPFVMSLILALQNVLLTFGLNMLVSIIVADLACADRDDPIRAKLFCTSVFTVGVTTLVQCIFGIRLPLLQGVSGAFFGPLMAVKSAGIWSCDSDGHVQNDVMSTNMTMLQNVTMTTKEEMVYERVTQLQGSLMAAGLVTEVFLGGTGLLGYVARFVGPITVCSTITSLALSVYPISLHYCSSFLPVAACGVVLMILCIMYLAHVFIPIPRSQCNRNKKCDISESRKGQKLPVFQVFPVFLTVVLTWALCGVLTITGALPDDPRDPAYRARTDTRSDLLSISPWFFVPYPGQFGPPRFNTAIFIGFVSSYLSSTIESIGDYMTISRATQTYPPPRHAVNRGILVEGLFGVLAGALGAGHATTSYSDNVVMVKLTQVASRSVMILAGIICMLFGVIGKVGAIMASVPDPVLGGVSVITFGMLAAIGLSTLQRVNMSSTRNIAVLGTSLYIGLFTAEWMKLNQNNSITGNASVDQILKVILGTQMFVAGVTSVILDNTVRGTKKDRGIEEMTSQEVESGIQFSKHRLVYDVPGITTLQKKIRCLRHIPFLQPYKST